MLMDSAESQVNMGSGTCYNKDYNGAPCPLFLRRQQTDDDMCATCHQPLTGSSALRREAPKTASSKGPSASLIRKTPIEKRSTVPRSDLSATTSAPLVEMISARSLTNPADLSLRDEMHVEVKGSGGLFGQIVGKANTPTLKVRVGGTVDQHVWVNRQDVVPHPTLKAMREDKLSRAAFSQALCQLTKVPLLHIIWFGGALPEDRMKALDTWIGAFDSLRVYVWADSRVRGWEAITKQFFGNPRCKVIDAQKALAESAQVTWTAAYEKEIGLKPRIADTDCFVASACASDVLRLVVVYRYGGLYLDMDMPLNRDWQQRDIVFPLNKDGFALLKWQTGKPVNAGMAAHEGSATLAKVIDMYLNEMAVNLMRLITAEDLKVITETMRQNLDRWYDKMAVYTAAKNFTMFRTGPDVLNEAVKKVLGAQWEKTHLFAVEGMHYGNELSWLSPRGMWFPVTAK